MILINALGFWMFLMFGAEGEWLLAFISIFSTFTLSVALEWIVSGSMSSRN